MEIRISNLKTEFNNISLVRSKIMNIFESLKNKSDKLKNLYSDFIKQGNTQLFVFGLDSFHFQSKFIDIEYDDMKRLFLAINNRMYCEYFKLYKIITEYIIKNINDKKVKETIKIINYPIYKDLEPYKEYKFETIQEIHENILNLISVLTSILSTKENELLIHKGKQSIGLNIDNFITTFNYNINIIREKINMFVSYIEFFHKMHTKYLKRFSNKIQLMHSHIDSDIRFDENLELSKDKKKELIENLDVGNNLSRGLLNDLKKSMHSETSSDSELDSKESMPTTSSIISNLSIANIKEMVKNNVGKVSNILQICSANNNAIDPNISYHDITKLFSNIELSCDEIINNENLDSSQHSSPYSNKNVGLSIDIPKNLNETENIYIDVLTKPIYEAKEDVINELKELIVNQNKEVLEEQKQELIQEQKQQLIQEPQNTKKKKKKNKRK